MAAESNLNFFGYSVWKIQIDLRSQDFLLLWKESLLFLKCWNNNLEGYFGPICHFIVTADSPFSVVFVPARVLGVPNWSTCLYWYFCQITDCHLYILFQYLVLNTLGKSIPFSVEEKDTSGLQKCNNFLDKRVGILEAKPESPACTSSYSVVIFQADLGLVLVTLQRYWFKSIARGICIFGFVWESGLKDTPHLVRAEL